MTSVILGKGKNPRQTVLMQEAVIDCCKEVAEDGSRMGEGITRAYEYGNERIKSSMRYVSISG